MAIYSMEIFVQSAAVKKHRNLLEPLVFIQKRPAGQKKEKTNISFVNGIQLMIKG